MNPSDTFFDIRSGKSDDSRLVTVVSESGVIECFVIVGETPKDLSEKLTNLTGKPAHHPIFALGFHYS